MGKQSQYLLTEIKLAYFYFENPQIPPNKPLKYQNYLKADQSDIFIGRMVTELSNYASLRC